MRANRIMPFTKYPSRRKRRKALPGQANMCVNARSSSKPSGKASGVNIFTFPA